MSATSYDQFFYDLRMSESGNDYSVVNAYGYLGAYQFGEAALVDLGVVSNDGSPFDNEFAGDFTGLYGVYSVSGFLSSDEAQDNAAADWFDLIWRRFRYYDLEIYDGQTLNGVSLTASGMIAGAHLGGVGGVRSIIESGGFVDAADAFGTSISDYILRFAGYEVPGSFVNNLDQANEIFGGNGDDGLYGQAGPDTLVGLDGDDLLHGGEGDDLLYGDGSTEIVSAESIWGWA